MREQPHYEHLLTRDFLNHHYNDKKMSFPAICKMLKEQGHNISIGTIYKYSKRHGIGRSCSEAKRLWAQGEPSDWDKTFLSEGMIEAIDGFMLGDGGINPQSNGVGRLRCNVKFEEFCHYMMSFFDPYITTVKSYRQESMKDGVVWQGQTRFHPDLHEQHLRWYPRGGEKEPPEDVRLTSKSVLLWYLGDGSLAHAKKSKSEILRLSTDGFSKEGTERLAFRLREMGIGCKANKLGRVRISTKGIPAFFNLIGMESPVSCYDKKFDLPWWRFEAKRMREAADELGVDYSRLTYLVKIGKIPCFRETPKSKPRFLASHMEACQKAIEKGTLY